MSTQKHTKSKQQLFRDMLVGVLLYSVVLGFFNDYTDILHTSSYSVTFMLAVVMQLLTYATLMLKDTIVGWFRQREGKYIKLGLGLSVWAVLFLSKFVFLAVIAIVFRQEVYISGFVGLILIIVCLTAIQKLAEIIDSKLDGKTQG